MRLMKLLWAVFAFATAAHGASFDAGNSTFPALRPMQQQAQAAHMAAELLARYHYKAVPLNDELSGKIFDQYLKVLDLEKLFFVQTDIDQMASLRTKLDDAILKEELAGPFAIFNLYARRSTERFAYARTLLRQGFDFEQNENYQYERTKEAWPKSETEIRDLWRKRVKNDWLRLKLAGKDDKSIVETLDKRFDASQKRIAKLTAEDAFQAFMNAYTTAIEPHTNYLGLRAAEDFGISMRLALVGVGAVLAEKDEYTTIRELVSGGPAALSGKLKIGDRIVGVAQGESGVMTDVTGWRVADTVVLIRGAPDSVVVLDVMAAEAGADGQHTRVSLVRKTISLEEQAAKKSILAVVDGKITRRVGVISLPSFYQDFEARRKGRPDFKSASRDVARLLAEFKQENIDSVLLDLRNNGGGSLTEAVELTGLFIDKGPVVQQRNAMGAVSIERDTDAGVAWNGPLGVLINRASASASEIFAAALQDYGRGLVIGEPSFGKGTVQTMVNLDQIAENAKPQFGELKMTVAQFFRINGGTTQLRGVTPDIAFPAAFDQESFGESSYDNPLPWVQIRAADYLPSGDLKRRLPILLSRHEARVKADKDFQYMQEDIAEIQLQRKKNSISLNESERRRDQDAQDARLKVREARAESSESTRETVLSGNPGPRRSGAPRDDGLQANERTLANELAAEKARKNAKDVLLIEAAHILSDEIRLLKSGAEFAGAFQ